MLAPCFDWLVLKRVRWRYLDCSELPAVRIQQGAFLWKPSWSNAWSITHIVFANFFCFVYPQKTAGKWKSIRQSRITVSRVTCLRLWWSKTQAHAMSTVLWRMTVPHSMSSHYKVEITCVNWATLVTLFTPRTLRRNRELCTRHSRLAGAQSHSNPLLWWTFGDVN